MSHHPARPATFVRMFRPEFAPLVASGAKCQTVRPTPRRMPRPGDKISLRCWTGRPYRSPQRVLREATITRIDTFSLDTHPSLRINDLRLKTRRECDAFAVADGFADHSALLAWFQATHGLPFEGIVIYWTPFIHQQWLAQAEACSAWFSAASSAQTLPEDWICDRCGKTSADTTVFWPKSRMDLDERVTLDEYGADEGQFFDGKDVALCGQCNGSHWSAPNGELCERREDFMSTKNDQSGSQHGLDERACGTNTVQETKRWVVEGWHKLGFWTEYGETPQPENEARERLAQCRGMLPQTAWRLVEAVERKTVIELLETSSLIAALCHPADGDGGAQKGLSK